MTRHTYVEVRLVQFIPNCSCGWRSPTPTSRPEVALESWQRHERLEHGRLKVTK
jgi:hypothetical protein